MVSRKALKVDVKQLVLHEAGYKCANPNCRTILTFDLHHLEQVADGGDDTADNLLALCPNCHALHHRGHIPAESIRAWKMLLLTINEAYDRRTIDTLIMLAKIDEVYLTGDGLLTCAAIVASGLVTVSTFGDASRLANNIQVPRFRMTLSEAGKSFVAAWKKGDQTAAVEASRPHLQAR